MKIIGFLQVRNEETSGHLARYIQRNVELFDELYVYDDASSDSTRELISPYATAVLGGRDSKFSSELQNKQELLSRIQLDCQENDAILWLDADEVLYASKEQLKQIIEESFSLGFDSLAFPHRNLWRSNHWFRVDDKYNDLHPARIWRVSDKLFFPATFGLHVRNEPLGLNSTRTIQRFPVVHFGFASTELILKKHEHYRQHWLEGYPLSRLVSEKGLKLEPLPASLEVMGDRFLALHEPPPHSNETEPERISPIEWNLLALKKQVEFELKRSVPEVTIVCLIYKDLKWLEFQYSQLLQLKADLPMGKVKILFVANNPTPEVLVFLRENLIPHNAVNTKPNDEEWFINSVYRGYNLGVEFSDTEYVFMVNSDMGYARGTLARAYARRDPKLFLASRLVEQGVMESGQYGIERSFGSLPKTFRGREFAKYVNEIMEDEVKDGGLFMPLLVHRQTFLNLGGFPEGNVSAETIDEYVLGGKPSIAYEGDDSIPGDRALVMRAQQSLITHKTAFDSIAYHFQAGERRSTRNKSQVRSGFAVVNSLMKGVNQERVLWGTLVERLSEKGAKVISVSSGSPHGPLGSLFSPLCLLKNTLREFGKSGKPRVSVSNASYSLSTPGFLRRVVYRQDSPPDPINRWIQRTNILRADSVLANDPEFVEAHNRRNAAWLPVPLSETWWERESKSPQVSKSKQIIFVGSFSETKGWSLVLKLVKSRTDLAWTLVSKYADDDHGLGVPQGQNWTVYRQLAQANLKTLVANSDLLVVASPYETQCLAALEALSQDIPVITTPTGFLGGFPLGKNQFGVVSNDLENDLSGALETLGEFQPRKFIESLNLLGEQSWERWDKSLISELERSFKEMDKSSGVWSFVDRAVSFGVSQARQAYRRQLKPWLLLILKRLRD